MHVVELERSLRQLHLSGMAAVLETRLHQAQAEAMAPIDLIACLVSDELTLRADRLLQRRRKQAVSVLKSDFFGYAGIIGRSPIRLGPAIVQPRSTGFQGVRACVRLNHAASDQLYR
jgi:hypothetical protein